MQPAHRRPARALALATLSGLVLLATACQPTVTTRGYHLDERRLALVQPGVTKREEVAGVLGTPSSTATFDDRNWYYITQRSERANFFREKQVAQDVVHVVFTPDGMVEKVERLDMAAAQPVTPDPDATRTAGNELSLFEQLIGNVGRFNRDAAPGSIFRDTNRPGGPGRGP